MIFNPNNNFFLKLLGSKNFYVLSFLNFDANLIIKLSYIRQGFTYVIQKINSVLNLRPAALGPIRGSGAYVNQLRQLWFLDQIWSLGVPRNK